MAQRERNPEIAQRDSSLVEADSSAALAVNIAGYGDPPPQRIAINSTILPAEVVVVEPPADVSFETSVVVNAELQSPKRPSKAVPLLFLSIGIGVLLVAFSVVAFRQEQSKPAEDSKNKLMKSDPPKRLHLEQKKQEQAQPLEDQQQPETGLEQEINWNKKLKRELKEMEEKHKKPERPASSRHPREEEGKPEQPPKREIPPKQREKTEG